MKFKILTLFPEIFPGPLAYSITGKAIQKKLFQIETLNIREFSKCKNKRVDDAPYGGGAGMILKQNVLQSALEYSNNEINSKIKKKTIFLSPGGKPINSEIVRNLADLDEITIICGRYEGIDERFLEYNEIEELSIGDFVLSGGEIAAIILIDTCVRLIPEVLGNKKSLKSESFQDYLLEYPQYTKPRNWKGIKVPDVLLSGNHEKISDWRLKKSIEKTNKVRPDLFKNYLGKNKGE